jgi:hypothetical protein
MLFTLSLLGTPSTTEFQICSSKITSRQCRQVTWLIILKASVKATPADAGGQGGTIWHVGLVRRILSNPEWTSADVLHRKLLGLQNRWSASLAMSTDGSFPSRPRQFRIRPVTAGPSWVTDGSQAAGRAAVLTA